MTIRANMLLATLAARQRWLDGRLRALERKQKITPPPAPQMEMDPSENGIARELEALRREYLAATPLKGEANHMVGQES